MTDTGVWLGTDEVGHSPEVAAWLAALPGTGGPARVLAQYAMRSREEIAEDRQRAERVAQAREQAENVADAARLGLIEPLHTHQDVLMRAAALSEIEDAQAERMRQRRLEERADRALARLAAAERQLTTERADHAQASRLANERLTRWSAKQRRAEEGSFRPSYRVDATNQYYYR